MQGFSKSSFWPLHFFAKYRKEPFYSHSKMKQKVSFCTGKGALKVRELMPLNCTDLVRKYNFNKIGALYQLRAGQLHRLKRICVVASERV
jgi:NAD-dependent DNA ligase